MLNKNGSIAAASAITYALTMTAVRRVMRTAMDNGAAAAIGPPRQFIVALPYGATVKRNPRPVSDQTPPRPRPKSKSCGQGIAQRCLPVPPPW